MNFRQKIAINSKLQIKQFADISYSKGMSLVEVFISLALFAVVIIAIGAFEANIFYYQSTVSGSFQTTQNSQIVLKTMLKELREVSPSMNGAYPLVKTGSTTLAFFSDSDNDGKTELITYSLIGNTLYRSVIIPTGSPAIYNSASQSTSTLITNVINGSSVPSFQYFDTYYTGTSSPMTQPVNIPSVRLIRVNQEIELDPNRSPLPIIYTIQASFRNLKSNL